MTISFSPRLFPRLCRLLPFVFVGALLCAAAGGFFLLPSWRSRAFDGIHVAGVWLGLIAEDSNAADGQTGGSQPADPAAQTAERITALEEKISKQEKTDEQLKAGFQQLQDQLKAATAEVAKSNDIAVRQQEQWAASLSSQGTATPLPEASKKINVNTATKEELDSLPGIGPTYAERIVAYREKNGKFSSVEDLTNVSGIGPAILAKVKDLVEISP